MAKKILCLVLICLLTFCLSGCWNYRGLNEITIVSGISIDKKEDKYELTFEVVDVSGSMKEKGPQSKIIESEGTTFFDAARNAKKRLANKLYFGNTNQFIISKQLATEEGIDPIIDWFLRDAELRETVTVIISQEETAKDILAEDREDKPIISKDITEIVDEDEKVTSSTEDQELYQVYTILKGKGKSLVLPAFHNTQNNKEPAVEVNGLAVFKKDKLVGFLSPEETKYFLFATNGVKGGILTCSTTGDKDDISLEITKNKTKTSYEYKDEKITVTIKPKMSAFIAEVKTQMNLIEKESVDKIKAAAAEKLTRSITGVVKKVQEDYDSDIFGFGSMIYKSNKKLWDELENDWDNIFKTIEVIVEPEIDLVNSAQMKKS